MGTSASLPTPKGGKWTPVKNNITDCLGGGDATPGQIVGGVVTAAKGLATNTPSPSRGPSSGGRGGSGGGGGGGSGGGRGGGGGGGGGRARVGRGVSGLAGFGAAVAEGGLDAGLKSLGLDELRGKTAAEVVARIAERLAETSDGLEYELLSDAFRDTLLQAAALEGDAGYSNLEAALQSFIETHGIEGLVSGFLTRYVFDRVWGLIESHVDRKADTQSEAVSLSSAVEQVCRTEVEGVIADAKTQGRFDGIAWFDEEGRRIGRDIVADLEGRLAALDEGALA
ncbi:MAG: hypothetical protein SF069_18935 [Phycisphaerae bacterium]|nr:hypothetical protein [Phycisphaerae bacterium]